MSYPSMMHIDYSPIYKYELPEGHRFPMIKYELLPQQLLHEGTVTPDHFFEPPMMVDSDILLTHTLEYLHKLNAQLLTDKEAKLIGFPMRPRLVERGKHIAMGTYQCTHYARQYGVALNIAGGTHHSYADHGEGFCVFNDIAIASNLMLDRKEANRIMVIDLDVHQGNGTAHIFKNRPEVFTFSMHGAKNYPVRKEQSDLDIGLADGTKDDIYLDTLQQNLPDLIQSFQPDFVFYLSGVDIIDTDKLGRLAVSLEGCKNRDRYVFETLAAHDIPVAVSMGGGYSVHLKSIIEAHANTFRMTKHVFDLD